MDFLQERNSLEATLQALINRGAARRLIDRLQVLQTEYADAATTAARKAQIEEELIALHEEAANLVDHERRLAAPPPPPPRTFVAIIALLIVAAIVGCFVLVFWFYAPSFRSEAKAAERSGALIYSTAILAIVGLGGSLLLHRLFIQRTGVSSRERFSGLAQFWTRPMMMLSGLITILFFGGIALYFRALDEPISTVRATRPILVFTLIVAMLGFGGLLMVRSLFGTDNENDLNRRFRLAREIFLVYAGIFGTIIGFYFGAADEGSADNPPSITLAGGDHTMTAQVTGGAAPFVGFLQREGPPLDRLMDGNNRLLTLQFSDAGSTDSDKDGIQDVCPIGATVTVVDGRGRRASADVTRETMTGWEGCPPATPAGNAGEASDNQSTDNGTGPTEETTNAL